MRLTQRLTGAHGALLVVDLQDKLLASIPGCDLLLANAIGLIQGARILGLPVWCTEQYPKGLGPTAASVAELIPERPGKTTFHCCAVPTWNSFSAAMSVTSRSPVSRPMCAWHRPPSNCSTWAFGSRSRPMPSLRAVILIGSSHSGGWNMPGPQSRQPSLSFLNGPRPPIGPSSRRSAN